MWEFFHAFPWGLAMQLRVAGIAGWGLVGLGFLAVALGVRRASAPRKRRLSVTPYRPKGLHPALLLRHRRHQGKNSSPFPQNRPHIW